MNHVLPEPDECLSVGLAEILEIMFAAGIGMGIDGDPPLSGEPEETLGLGIEVEVVVCSVVDVNREVARAEVGGE
jgi:hypothetical protein